MKPLLCCPNCQSPLEPYQAHEKWFQQSCQKRCSVEYRQYFLNSFQDEELRYITFSTKHFHIYVYFQNDPLWPNKALIYSKSELTAKGVAAPIFTLAACKIDVYDTEELDRKLQILALFS